MSVVRAQDWRPRIPATPSLFRRSPMRHKKTSVWQGKYTNPRRGYIVVGACVGPRIGFLEYTCLDHKDVRVGLNLRIFGLPSNHSLAKALPIV